MGLEKYTKIDVTLYCDNCGKELSGNDEIYVDNDGCIYCSENCLLNNNVYEETTAQDYIDEWGGN